MLEIYISSLAFIGKEAEEMISLANREKFNLEFSSGIPYRSDMEDVYLNAPINKMLHNYFPAPKIPFVLNLASSNHKIRTRSIYHCLNGLRLASKSNNSFFSAHAGFCVDPDPNELGRKITYTSTFDKNEHKALFLDSLSFILKEADCLGLDFLIENNVITDFNLLGEINPLLCCESKDIKWLFEVEKSERLGILLDTAHLKVSCQTLTLNLEKELNEISKFIRAIHHSDNNGLVDSNNPMDESYWFLPHLKAYQKKPHVIEVKKINVDTIKQQIKLLQKHGY